MPSRAGDCCCSETADRVSVNEQSALLLDEYGNRILRLAYSYLHNMSDAEDILQDTLMRFLKAAPVSDGPGTKRRGCFGWRQT